MMDVQHDGPRAIKLTVGARRNDQQDCKLASLSYIRQDHACLCAARADFWVERWLERNDL